MYNLKPTRFPACTKPITFVLKIMGDIKYIPLIEEYLLFRNLILHCIHYPGRKLKMLNCYKYTALVCTVKHKPKEKQRGKSDVKNRTTNSTREKKQKVPIGQRNYNMAIISSNITHKTLYSKIFLPQSSFSS